MKLQKEWQICPYCGAANKMAKSPATVAPTVAAPERPFAGAAPASRTYRALVVDDQADFRRLVSFTLENSGLPISVQTASSGREALEHVEQDKPDVILLDVMMPEMDGFQVCEQLRGNVRTAFIPILMLTALDDSSSRARGFLAGTDDYIAKPFARAELLARVRRLLERSYGTMLPAAAVAAMRDRADAAGPARQPSA